MSVWSLYGVRRQKEMATPLWIFGSNARWYFLGVGRSQSGVAARRTRSATAFHKEGLRESKEDALFQLAIAVADAFDLEIGPEHLRRLAIVGEEVVMARHHGFSIELAG